MPFASTSRGGNAKTVRATAAAGSDFGSGAGSSGHRVNGREHSFEGVPGWMDARQAGNDDTGAWLNRVRDRIVPFPDWIDGFENPIFPNPVSIVPSSFWIHGSRDRNYPFTDRNDRFSDWIVAFGKSIYSFAKIIYPIQIWIYPFQDPIDPNSKRIYPFQKRIYPFHKRNFPFCVCIDRFIRPMEGSRRWNCGFVIPAQDFAVNIEFLPENTMQPNQKYNQTNG